MEDRISVNLQAFQVTYEQHVQTLVQEAVNSVKAFFDIAVQAMNDKADQVGRSTMQNEGMINVQIARIDDVLSRLARLESAATPTFAAPNWRAGTSTRRDNIVSKEELENVANGGDEEWTYSTEQVDELMVHVIEWINRQNTLEDVTDAEFHRWANGSGAGLGVVVETALLPHERQSGRWRQRYRACRSKQR